MRDWAPEIPGSDSGTDGGLAGQETNGAMRVVLYPTQGGTRRQAAPTALQGMPISINVESMIRYHKTKPVWRALCKQGLGYGW